MATIRDVGKLAGVSVATVSRVINKKGYVNKNTEEKILKAMEMLNYTPSDVARRLAGKQSKTIGLIIPDILNPFFPEIARAVEDSANKLGYSVILCNTDNDISKESQYFDMLINKQVDGIIISSYATTPDALIKIIDKGMPVVLIDNEFPGYNIPTVTSNNFEGGRIATKHLIENGCRKIAHITGPLSIKSIKDRFEGYHDVCLENKIYYPEILETTELSLKNGYEKTKELLSKNKDVDGIFAGTDILAIGCYKALVDMGYRVPEDVKLIGYDGLVANTDYLSISSIEQQIYACGKLAVEVLYNKIEGDIDEMDNFKLNVSLAKRKSTVGNEES